VILQLHQQGHRRNEPAPPLEMFAPNKTHKTFHITKKFCQIKLSSALWFGKYNTSNKSQNNSYTFSTNSTFPTLVTHVVNNYDSGVSSTSSSGWLMLVDVRGGSIYRKYHRYITDINIVIASTLFLIYRFFWYIDIVSVTSEISAILGYFSYFSHFFTLMSRHE